MITPLRRLAYRLRDARSRYIWNRNPPQVGAYHRDVPYVPGAGRKQSLDVVVPRESCGPSPVLVYLHGGGWQFGDKGSSARICRCFAAGGVLVINANYRLAPRWGLREQLEDVSSAVLWARDNAARFDGDPERLVLAGESAGAHLASLYAAAALDGRLWDALCTGTDAPQRIERLLLFYGVYDLTPDSLSVSRRAAAVLRGFLGDGGESLAERARLASPSLQLREGYPPALICSGEADVLHAQSVAFARALSSAGITHRTRFFADPSGKAAPHGFLAVYTLETAQAAIRYALEFINEPLETAGDSP